MLPRLLFCLKYREGYWGAEGSDLSSGLKNSVTFIVDMLNENGIEARVVQLRDNNAIDKAIHEYRPTHVILEAFWVVPSKLDVLMPLHPHVHWAVRNHSEMAFLANEGMGCEWVYGYLSRGVELMNNSPRAVDDMRTIARAYGHYQDLVTYAPNYYPLPCTQPVHVHRRSADNVVKIGCYGAIRPLKNQLTQAVAAIKFGHFLGRKLEYHINATRVEGYGAPIIKNLKELFSHTHRAKLIEHPWLDRTGTALDECQRDFLEVMREMDFSLQCSFSETFNIVSADAVLCNVPVITSAQVPWLRHQFHADPNDSQSIFQHLINANQHRHDPVNTWLRDQWDDLSAYSQESQAHWVNRFGVEAMH
jgi:glycosyltransferase involved in cell wall biosynthesis